MRFDLPFLDAIRFFRDKLGIPTSKWDELWQAEHSKSFTVAGALRDDLLSDIREAVASGINDGTTLATFRKAFSSILERTGWEHKGGFGWRSAVIFNTNLSTAYSAGRWQQQTDPAVLSARPFLRYVPSSSMNPRAEHMQWYNLVLPADDPFWDTHYPPNGWGCKCGVVSVSGRELVRLQEKFAGSPFAVQTEAPPVETYEYTKSDGETVNVPYGIDPGWAYNPGKRDASPNVAKDVGGFCSCGGRRTPDIDWEYWLQFRRAA